MSTAGNRPDSAIPHDVPVEDAAHRVAHRLVGVVPLDQHGKQPGDAAAPFAGPGPLQEPRQLGED
jgi:hypothetical protein